jgi:hypothetical protein
MHEDISFFVDKSVIPTEESLKYALAETYPFWIQIQNYVITKYPQSYSEWSFPGAKFGWSFRIKDKKRVIIYLLPRHGYFKVALVFGDKAVNEILNSDISQNIKTELSGAKKYAEGRGIRIEINNSSILSDIEKLIEFKLTN